MTFHSLPQTGQSTLLYPCNGQTQFTQMQRVLCYRYMILYGMVMNYCVQFFIVNCCVDCSHAHMDANTFTHTCCQIHIHTRMHSLQAHTHAQHTEQLCILSAIRTYLSVHKCTCVFCMCVRVHMCFST